MACLSANHSTAAARPNESAPALGGAVRTSQRRIRELDALRGIAALIVVIHHVFVIFHAEVRATITGLAFDILNVVQAQNKAAVLTFFVLSGYAIGIATRGREPVTGVAIADYASRRARRILPLYWFSLAWTAALGLAYGAGEPSFSWQTLLGNAAFLQTSAVAKGNWFDPYGLNGPYWSLSYEAFFYAMLPTVLLLVRRGPLAAHPKTALIAIGCAATFAGFAGINLVPTPFAQFLCPWVVWIVGYVAVDLPRGWRSLALVAAPLLLIGGAVQAMAVAGLSSDTLGSVLTGTAIAFVFAAIALYHDWTAFAPVRALRRLLIALFGRIGDGSYALYLLHYPLLLALHAWLDAPFGAMAWWLAGAGLVVFTILVCPWLETTATRLARPRPPSAKPGPA